MNKRMKGYAYLIICILLWAAIPVVTKNILDSMDVPQMLFYTSFTSLLTLSLFSLLHRVNWKRYDSLDYIHMAFLGFLGAYLYYIFLYGALSMTTAQEGFILAYTWPILVLVLAFLILRERITVRKVIAILLSFSGIIIITTRGNMENIQLTNLFGDLLAIGGAFVFALFSILGKKSQYDRIIAAFVYFLVATISSFLTMLLVSRLIIPSLSDLAYLLFNGILINGLTYIWWFKALDNLETHVVSTTLYLTPFISLVYIYAFLHEEIMLSSIVGLIVIVAGIFLQIFQK